jgi:hypothetical protein
MGRIIGVAVDRAWGGFTRGALIYDTVVMGLFVAGSWLEVRARREEDVAG